VRLTCVSCGRVTGELEDMVHLHIKCPCGNPIWSKMSKLDECVQDRLEALEREQNL
jgi:phage FluMu protein Com